MQTKLKTPRKPRAKKATEATASASEATATEATASEATEQAETTAQTLPAITAQPEQTEQAKAETNEPTKAEQIAAARQLAAAIFAVLSDAVSIPVKSTRAFKLNRDLQPHAIGRKPSPRQAAAIVIALAASKQRIENGATFARTFTMRGESYAIENGAASDFLKSGLATYHRDTESFTVIDAANIRAQLGKALSGFNI